MHTGRLIYNSNLPTFSTGNQMVITKGNLINNLKNMVTTEGDIPDDTLTPGKIRLQLFLTSFVILFFELICIRWLPAYVRFLGYFMNFIMLASFLGIGLGIMVSSRDKLWLPNFFFCVFFLL